MDFTWAWLLATVALVIVGIAQYTGFVKEVKSRKTWTALGLIGVVFFALTGLGFIPITALNGAVSFGGDQELSVSSGDQIDNTVGGKCLSADDTTVTLSGRNKYTAVPTGGTHAYRIDGGIVKTVSDAGTFTTSPGQSIQIMWGNGSSGGNYFSDIQTVVIPCRGTADYTRDLVQNGTITIDIYNRDGDKMNSASANQSISQGQEFTLDLRLTAPNDAGFPYGGIVVIEVNDTSIDDVEVTGGSKVSTPSFYKIQNTEATTRTYEIGALENNAELDTGLVVTADSSIDPQGDLATLVTFYPYNVYIDEEKGGAFVGPSAEDEKSTQVDPAHTTQVEIFLT